MVSVDGQWRIAQAPPGLLLSSAQLERAFETRYVYFIDPTGTIAVPDLRVLPRTEPQALSTALVSSLLAGPSPWLAPAVRTELPAGLQLALGAVPVTDGTARVELSGPAITLDADASKRLGAQLAWTLRQVPGAHSAQLILNGAPVVLDDRAERAYFSAYSSSIRTYSSAPCRCTGSMTTVLSCRCGREPSTRPFPPRRHCRRPGPSH